jgi:co-chaperonin GroES (HSP10)
MKDGQTFGQWLNWDFKANGSLKIKNKNGDSIYLEVYSGRWRKREYDSDGNLIYDECSEGIIFDKYTPEIIEHNGRKYQLIP